MMLDRENSRLNALWNSKETFLNQLQVATDEKVVLTAKRADNTALLEEAQALYDSKIIHKTNEITKIMDNLNALDVKVQDSQDFSDASKVEFLAVQG